MADPRPARPFRLLRWFGGLSAVAIGILALANGWLLSSVLNEQLFRREATLSRDFVRSVFAAHGDLGPFSGSGDPKRAVALAESLGQLSHLQDVMRANLYGVDRSLLWSSDPRLVGRRFEDNEELDEALRGELVVNAGRIDPAQRGKGEYEGLSAEVAFFVETYIPMLDPASGQVLAVVELYKAPLALTQAIESVRRQVVVTVLLGGLVLYLSLFALVRRADRLMRQQQDELATAQTRAAVGELAASVAHNIRNPLASIRATAELGLEAPEDLDAEGARDILHQVDRISKRIDDLLRLSRDGDPAHQHVALAPLLKACVEDHQPSFRRRDQSLRFEAVGASGIEAFALADASLLQQVLGSVLANACEAMGPGGACHVRLDRAASGLHRILVQDNGPGISATHLDRVLRPFFTTKPQGMGLGLALAHRIVERLGGSFQVMSVEGHGTSVLIELPVA
jgi:signal transduction histidine kinase